MHYAGFWIRFVAYLIDGILLGIVAGIVYLISDTNWSLSTGVGSLVGWIYFASMESSERQATLGKSVMGIYVTGYNGERISFLRATGRYFAKILSALLFGLGYLMAAFTARKQALHDMLASTLVYKRG